MNESDAIRDIRYSLHQLAQPLAAVTGLVDLLLLEGNPGDAMYDEIQLISQKLEQILEIIGHIREVAREAASTPAPGIPAEELSVGE